MTRPRPPDRVPPARRAGAWLAWWVLLMSFWVILDDSIAPDELVAGAAAAALGAFLAELVSYQAAARLQIRASWLVRVITLPGQIAGDTVIVFAALWRRLARGQEPRSGFRRRPVRYGDGTAAGQTRRALLIGAASLAPNTIAAGLDRDSGTMLVHQLVVSEGEEAE